MTEEVQSDTLAIALQALWAEGIDRHETGADFAVLVRLAAVLLVAHGTPCDLRARPRLLATTSIPVGTHASHAVRSDLCTPAPPRKSDCQRVERRL